MSIDKTQLRELIREVLKKVDLWDENSEELLMLTCAQESNLGTYIKQLGKGGAVGVFQMEVNTFNDIIDNYLAYKPELADTIKTYLGCDYDVRSLRTDLAVQIIFARLHYLRTGKPSPPKTDARGMANMYKKYYNTVLGAATIDGTVKKYKQYVLEG